MTIKETILDCLSQDDEALTQIYEYCQLPPSIKILRFELKQMLDEMIKDGLVFINYNWKTEKDEYPYSLTEKGKEAWRNIQE